MKYIYSFNNYKRKYYLENFQCSVSKASNEIMLDRLSVGPKLEFPFSNILKQ